MWEKGEAGFDFRFNRVIEPDYFQSLFLITGSILSLALIALLVDILTNASFGFFKLMPAGILASLLITSANLFYFSTSLWKPIFVDYGQGDLFMGEYEIDMEMLVKHRIVAIGILGYGAVTSFIFIFVAMMRSLGNQSFPPDN